MALHESQRFQLVLVHGIRDHVLVRQTANKFWSTRFPKAIITDCTFLDDTAASSFLNFTSRSERLLEAILSTTQLHPDQVTMQCSASLPCIIICHELGGYLAKQALVLAAQDSRYSRLINNLSALILCGDSDVGDGNPQVADWEHTVLRSLANAKLTTGIPHKLLHELPSAFNHLHSTFAGLQKSFRILNVTASGGKLSIWGTRSNVIRTLSPQRVLDWASPATEDELWNFASGEPVAEMLFDVVDRSTHDELRDLPTGLRVFLGFLECVDNYNNHIHSLKPVAGSLNYLDHHQSYQEWRHHGSNTPGILYVSGPSGSGTSFIASHMVATLQVTVPDVTVVSYSFSAQYLDTQPITTLYVSMIRQILLNQPTLYSLISSVCERVSNSEKPISSFLTNIVLLRQMFLSLLTAMSPGPVFCIIHGADQCEPSLVAHIEDLLRQQPQSTTGVCKFAFLSEKFEAGPSNCACWYIDLTNDNLRTSSVDAYVHARIEVTIDKRPEWVPFKKLISERLRTASTTVLHAALGIKLLETAEIPLTQGGALLLFQNLSLSLDEMYRVALHRAQQHYEFSVPLFVQWILHSTRPFSLREVAIVAALAFPGTLSFKQMKTNLPFDIHQTLRHLDGILLKVVGVKVYPIHRAMSHITAASGQPEQADPHSIILARLLDYLEMILEPKNQQDDGPLRVTSLGSTDSVRTGSKFLDQDQLALTAYAVQNWPEHFRMIPERSKVSGRVLKFLSNRPIVLKWAELYELHQYRQPRSLRKLDHPLKIISRFGFVDLFQVLVCQEKSLHEFDDAAFRSLLSESLELAAGRGHLETVEALLLEDAFSNNAMCVAAEYGHTRVLKRLLIARPDIVDHCHELENSQAISGRSPFVLSVTNGHLGSARFILSQYGNPIEVIAGLEAETLISISTLGLVDMLRLLIDAGLDMRQAHTTPILFDMVEMAAAGGFREKVAALMEYGGVDFGRKELQPAFHRAIRHGQRSICDVMMEAGVDVNAPAEDGMTPVHFASKFGHLSILKRLLFKTKDANHSEPEAEESLGGSSVTTELDSSLARRDLLTPLEMAASYGHLNAVKELLKHESYATQRNRESALRAAAESGYADVVDELLKSHITTMAGDANGNNALHLASRKQHVEVLDRLLDNETEGIFDVNAKNLAGWTALHFAAEQGRLQTVKTLIQHGARADVVTSEEQTPLHISALHGNVQTLEDLLGIPAPPSSSREFSGLAAKERGIDGTLICDATGHTPFTLALSKGHVDVARSLLERAQNLFPDAIRGLEGKKDAICIAVEGGSEECVHLVFQVDWEHDASNVPRSTGTHEAAKSGSVSMIKFLQHHRQDIDAKNSEGQTPLHIASTKGSVEVVELLLQLGANINTRDEDGAHALYLAASAGAVDVVEELLKWSPELDVKCISTGYTALHISVNYPAIVKMLLAAGSDATIATNRGSLALLLAAGHPNGLESVQHFMNAKVDPNDRGTSADGWMPLHMAALAGIGISAVADGLEDIRADALEIVQLLVSNGADLDFTIQDGDGRTAIHLAASHSRTRVVEYLIRQNAKLDVDCAILGTPLMAAAKVGGETTVQALLRGHADPNAASAMNGFHSALQTASWNGAKDVIQMLLQHGADVNLNGGWYFGSALCAAVYQGDMECIMMLLDANANIDFDGELFGTAIEVSIYVDRWAFVDVALEKQANLNLVSKSQLGTALLASIGKGNLEYVEKLLKHGADATLCPKDGRPPVLVAAQKGELEILKALLAHLDGEDGNVAMMDQYNRCLLSHAIESKSSNVIKYLLELSTTKLNEQSVGGGHTPLMLAAMQGSSAVVDIMKKRVDNTWDIDIQDNFGMTALMHAVQGDSVANVNLILEAGAGTSILDARGRDALYWAALSSGIETFEVVFNAMAQNNAPQSCFQLALSAAVARDSEAITKKLLDRVLRVYDPKLADQDGWGLAYVALRFDNRIMSTTALSQYQQDFVSPGLFPSEWHPQDHSSGVVCGPDQRSILVKSEVVHLGIDNPQRSHGLARANHPMVPGKDGVYYFEVKIEKRGNADKIPEVGVGFCEENVPVEGAMVGWAERSWGYHGDDGKRFNSSTGYSYGDQFDEGDVIGCGVNFSKGIAFYTKNGLVVGQAFTGINGRLYPAVSFDTTLAGCTVLAEFWSEALAGNPNFIFKGPFDGLATLEKPRRLVEAEAKAEAEAAQAEAKAKAKAGASLRQRGDKGNDSDDDTDAE